MYMIEKANRKDAVGSKTVDRLLHDMQPCGCGLPADQGDDVHEVQVWGSSFGDPGADYCEFRLFSDQGTQIKTIRVEGY